MAEFVGLKGKRYSLPQQSFSSGGEGGIYTIKNQSDICAKIYHSGNRSIETEKKLKIMYSNPPDKSVLSQIAWPLDILYTQSGDFAGFIMPKIDVSDELIDVYEYPPSKYKKVTLQQKLIVAQNICAVIDAVHNAGFVFGDFNPLNIGVDMNTGHVAFWDTDSYHIKDKKAGVTYRCNVCLDGYVAPELIKKCKNGCTFANAPLETFTQETDNFALAIHIFKLLMNGFTPFNGIVANKRLSSSLAPGVGNEPIEKNQYCFKPGNIPLSSGVPDKQVFTDELVGLFERAFIDGHINPMARPTAREWHSALYNYENELCQCRTNPIHMYKKTLPKCPWCEVEKKMNINLTTPTSVPSAVANVVMPQQSTLTNRNYTSPTYQNSWSQSPRYKKKSAAWEVGVLVVCVVAVIASYFLSYKAWGMMMETDSKFVTDNKEVTSWQRRGSDYYKEDVVFSGRVNHRGQVDTYTLSTSGRNYRYEVKLYFAASNEEKLSVWIEEAYPDESGERDFLSFDEFSIEELASGVDFKLPAGKKYYINVKATNGTEADYALTLSR